MGICVFIHAYVQSQRCTHHVITTVGLEAIIHYGSTFYDVIRNKDLSRSINPLNAELNPIFHLLALLGTHHILHISRIRVKT